MTVTTPIQPAPEWQLQPVQIALVNLAGEAMIGATLTLLPDSRIPLEIVGADGPITVFPSDLGPFTSVAGVLNGAAVGMIETSLPISNDPDVNRELTYTATLKLPGAGGLAKATVFVEDIVDPGVLWLGPSFINGAVTSGSPLSPAITGADFTALQSDVQGIIADGGSGTAATTATIAGAGTTGRVLMESETPTIAGAELGLAIVATTGAYTDLVGAPAAGVETVDTIGGTGTTGRAVMKAETAAVGRTALSLADVAATGAYTDLVGAPAAVTAASLGLDQVDNTADVDKPISTAVASALTAKAATAALATVATSGAYSDLIGAPAGGTETTATLGGTGATGVELMESATPTVARAALVLGTAATTAATDYATAAQGGLADSSTQPADLSAYVTVASLGTAATTDSTAYATAAQGGLADSATQPADLAGYATTASLGTAATTDASDYASAAEGTLAGTAVQPPALALKADQVSLDATNAAVSDKADSTSLSVVGTTGAWLDVIGKPVINGITPDSSGNYTIPTGTGGGTIVTTETSAGSGIYTVSAV